MQAWMLLLFVFYASRGMFGFLLGLPSSRKFLFAVHAAVNVVFAVSEFETVGKFLLNRCDTSWVFAFYDVRYKLW